jgi:hypothetical protein
MYVLSRPLELLSSSKLSDDRSEEEHATSPLLSPTSVSLGKIGEVGPGKEARRDSCSLVRLALKREGAGEWGHGIGWGGAPPAYPHSTKYTLHVHVHDYSCKS